MLCEWGKPWSAGDELWYYLCRRMEGFNDLFVQLYSLAKCRLSPCATSPAAERIAAFQLETTGTALKGLQRVL